MDTGAVFFDELLVYHQANNTLKDKYTRLRLLLERVCRNMTAGEHMQFSNLFSRLNYVCRQTKLNPRATYRINTFRIHANSVLHNDFNPTEEDYLQDLKAICEVISHFYGIPVPAALQPLLPEADVYKPQHRRRDIRHERIRVTVLSNDEQYIYAFDEETPADVPIRICHHTTEIKEAFGPTIAVLWKGCQLNLLDVVVDEDNIYYPDLIILEPDYLVDISSLAECMKEYGSHPLYYIQSKLEAPKNSRHILLGNAANVFLDEFVNEKDHQQVVYKDIMQQVFRSLPFEFATCADLGAKEHEWAFFEEARLQFNNIRQVVNEVFPARKINRENGILEPSFICEHLGVQGRLDYLQLEADGRRQIVIELKSGRSPYPETNTTLIGKNHRSQAFIYQIVIQKVLGVAFKQLDTFILYSRYADSNASLRLSQPFMAAIKEILNIRNLIVAQERSIANDQPPQASRQLIDSIKAEVLIPGDALQHRFVAQYILPQIGAFKRPFVEASPLALAYFHSFYTFVIREHYISKAGDTDHDTSKGISSLWLSPLEDKLESGEILPDLSILENNAAQPLPSIRLQIPVYEEDFMPNFREGDIVILYQRNSRKDNVTNRQIFKGTIASLTPHEITIRLRYRQRNPSVLPGESKYAVEHDFLDSSYTAMCRGLYAFLQAGKDRQELLLHQRSPRYETGLQIPATLRCLDEVKAIVLKAMQAKDYFLLLGPPGTGKTSVALKSMVEAFAADPACNILLLSYTNRAVDEICKALHSIENSPAYIRIGPSLSCEPAYRGRLLEQVIADCDNRTQVRAKIQEHRLFVGTVAAISGKMELFRLKRFDVAIIDEASQILEPHLLGILSARDTAGHNAIGKFILIGDHKQLPAVVLQREQDSRVNDPALRAIGLTDRRCSLFERLYQLHKEDPQSPVWGMLRKQGRMHPDIAMFPNTAFYNGQLQAVPLPHQSGDIEFAKYDPHTPLQVAMATKRLLFIPSAKQAHDKHPKSNPCEADIVATLLQQLYGLYRLNGLPFTPDQSIGVIAPYRNQIACIKRSIHQLQIPALNDITVDTVERYQGSQRDIIIYSFCVNQRYQLDLLANETVDEGQLIDRKLNVAITRARKQLFITGEPTLLCNNPVYQQLIAFIRERGGYMTHI
ncbi:AAA domain-containing protein [uncultured Chitinophaga sp.]|jgi:Superfamily I DNA and RNA helicases and helicase subunits|uniref:DEAD/DEAH box helicase n=1 Tax=uncultured Chitinophaga sp. TaxID=339340 RepID=UPI00261E2748|nr:AAA domain-containing protein [uncultured Chitinophaga sp.]